MKIFEERLIKEVIGFIEKENIISKLNTRLNEIKFKKIDNTLLDKNFIDSFEFKKEIFSDKEKKIILSTTNDSYSKKYINNRNTFSVLDILGIYMNVASIVFVKNNKNNNDLKIDLFKEENLKMENAIYLDYNIFLRFEEYKEKIKKLLEENSNSFLVYSDMHTAEISCIEESKEKDETISKIYLTIKKDVCNTLIRDDGIYKADFTKMLNLAEKQPILKISRIIKVLEYSSLDYNFYSENDPTNKIVKYIKENKLTPIILNNMTLDEIFKKHTSLEEYFLTLSKNKEFTPIFSIMLFMDCIGYKKDKEFKTIISSFFDELHLEYAIKTKFFVTRDKLLGKRAEEIFRYLKSGTKVCIL